MHPQTLRQYDRLGLVSPGRATGRGRRYSLRDIATLREVQRLSQEEGINLAGIKRILVLEEPVERLRRQIEALRGRAVEHPHVGVPRALVDRLQFGRSTDFWLWSDPDAAAGRDQNAMNVGLHGCPATIASSGTRARNSRRLSNRVNSCL